MPETSGGMSEEQAWKQNQETFQKKLKEANAPEVVIQVESLTDNLQNSLLSYMARKGSDKEVLGILNEVFRGLDTSLGYGDASEQLNDEKLKDVKAGLIGAAKVLDPAAERRTPPIEPIEHAGLAHRFLELTERRVGTIDKATGTSTLRMRISKDNVGDTVTYTKKQ
jgi:hypothetical protein